MKEVVRRDREEKLKIEQKEDSKYFYCKECGRLLVAVYNDKEWGMMSSCPHFQWEEFTVSCYIGIGDECDINEIKRLRSMSLIQIFDDLNVNLLVPK